MFIPEAMRLDPTWFDPSWTNLAPHHVQKRSFTAVSVTCATEECARLSGCAGLPRVVGCRAGGLAAVAQRFGCRLLAWVS
jgi:hypothetical protein